MTLGAMLSRRGVLAADTRPTSVGSSKPRSQRAAAQSLGLALAHASLGSADAKSTMAILERALAGIAAQRPGAALVGPGTFLSGVPPMQRIVDWASRTRLPLGRSNDCV